MKKAPLAACMLLLATFLAAATDSQAAGDYASRTIENGTAITLTVDDTVIPATLNNSKSAQELLSRLPYTVTLRRYSHDYCGVMDDPLS